MTTKKFIAFSCVHVPHHDPEAISRLLDVCRAHNPDVVVCLGDLLDADAASRWENETEHILSEEYAQADEILSSIVKCTPRAKHVWCLGNHDDNILAQGRLDRRIRDMVDFRARMESVRSKRWQVLPYIYNPNAAVYRLGQVSFFHGFESSNTADRNQCVRLGREWGLTVSGHTHRPTHNITQCYATQSLPLCRWYANVGTLSKIGEDVMTYVKRRNTERWGQAVCIGEAADIKSPREGRYWDAEMVMFKRCWDTDTIKTWRSALSGK